MSMIIAGGGGGSASVFTGEGRANVHFSASGTGRVTGASVETQIQAVQNAAMCNGGTTQIVVPLPEPVTGGDFLAAAVTLGGGAKVVSINDLVEGYDAIVATLNPIGWWKYNELSGNIAYDSGSGDNNGLASGGFTVGQPGPITGTPADTAYQFYQYGGSVGTASGALGTGLLGTALLGDGAGSQAPGQVAVAPAADLQFGTTSFSIAGWISGTSTASDGNAYIFNSSSANTGASVVRGPLGWAIRGSGIMGGGILKVSSAGYALQMNEGTDRLEFVVSDNDGNTIAVQTSVGYGNTGWHFVVGVVNRITQEMSLYVDGALIGSDSVAGVGSVNNTATVPTMGEGLEGDLSQVFLTDYALTSAEIAQLYSDRNIAPSGNRWIQAAYSYCESFGTEIWYARGVKEGVTVTTVNITASGASVTCCANISEFSGVWYVDPLDAWSQNFGVEISPAVAGAVQPRTNGDLFIAVAEGIELTGDANGYVPLPIGGTGRAAYYVSPFSVSESPQWTTLTNPTWATCHAAFVQGEAGYNPEFQFPETLVEISTVPNYMLPLEGYGTWTNISRYVEAMDLGPLGKQHLLDRVDATTANITVNNRDGTFNRWNSESFLYGGLMPMNPVKVSAAWDGITSNQYWGYIQNVQPAIADVLNVNANIACNDIMALLNLKYLSNSNYADLVMADGGANLMAYYRLGENPNIYLVSDSSGYGNNGSLINGANGEPTFGAQGVMIYDTDSALDLTSGTNAPNGGFSAGIDVTTEPPTTHNPLGDATNWTIEMWFQYTGGTTYQPTPPVPAVGTSASAAPIPNQTLFRVNSPSETEPFSAYEIQLGFLGVDPLANGYIQGAVVEAFAGSGPNAFVFPTNPFDGNWHHLVKNNSNEGIWLDGNAPTMWGSFYSTQITNPISGLVIGTGPGGVGLDPDEGQLYAVPFAGVVDEVALYSIALSQIQAQDHFSTALWFQQQEFGAANGGPGSSRLGKVLAVAGIDPATILAVPYDFSTLLYAESDTVTTTSALNYIQTMSQTEPGLIWQGVDGKLYAFNREFQYVNPTSTTPQAIFSDDASSNYFYDGPSLQIAGDDTDLWSDVQVQSGIPATATTEQIELGVLQEWGPAQSSLAAYSASVYGNRTLQGLTALQFAHDSDALAVAQWLLSIYVLPIQRVTQMTINAQGNGGANIPQMLQRILYDHIIIKYAGQTPGPPFVQGSIIESVTHSVDMSVPQWSTAYSMSPYEILLEAFYLDESQMDGTAVLVL